MSPTRLPKNNIQGKLRRRGHASLGLLKMGCALIVSGFIMRVHESGSLRMKIGKYELGHAENHLWLASCEFGILNKAYTQNELESNYGVIRAGRYCENTMKLCSDARWARFVILFRSMVHKRLCEP